MSSKNKQLYMDVAGYANTPLSARKKVVNGRGGESRVPRKYHLKAEKLIEVRRQIAESGHFVSPYGANRLYSFIIDALVSLGVGKSHSVSTVYKKFQEIASKPDTIKAGKTAWQRFVDRPCRNVDTGRDDFTRFLQNIEVLQRLGGNHPYGLKLAQVGACIDIVVDANRQVKIMLRTGIADGDPVQPINTNRKRKYTKTVDSVPAGLIINENEPLSTLENDDDEEID
jgi:hypothetical protein